MEKLQKIIAEQHRFPIRTLSWEKKRKMIEKYFHIWNPEKVYHCHYDEKSLDRRLIAEVRPEDFNCTFYVDLNGEMKKTSHPPLYEYKIETRGYIFVTEDYNMFWRLVEKKIFPSLVGLCLTSQIFRGNDQREKELPLTLQRDLSNLRKLVHSPHPSKSDFLNDLMAYNVYNGPSEWLPIISLPRIFRIF